MYYRKGENIGFASMDGIWADYHDHVWYFLIKDRVWQKEEIRAAMHNHINVTFFSKGCVDGFLLEIEDCLETSDIPFCVKDADESFFETLNGKQDESWAVVLVDEDGTVASVRTHVFSHENSTTLKQWLLNRKEEGYTSENFDLAYDKIMARYEPYELEQFAKFTEKGEKK